MYNPLVIFTGAALATLAALMGVTYDKWSGATPHDQAAVSLETKTGPAAPAAALQDLAKPSAPEEPAQQPSTELASISPDEATSPGAQPESTAVEPQQPAAQPEPPLDESKPTFDTIRIERDGSAVMAGRGMPDMDVIVMLDGQPMGSTKADSDGAWVFIPDEPVPPGDHQLTLRMQTTDAVSVESEQFVALKVPDRIGDEALVVLRDLNQASKVLQKPEASANETTVVKTSEASVAEEAPVAESEPSAQESSPQTPADKKMAVSTASLTLGTVDYNDKGDIIFSGTAEARSSIRVYVDNKPVGDAAATSAGSWTFAGKEEIAPGTHSLRVDQLRRDGSVSQRIELPFVRAAPREVAALNQSLKPQPQTEAPPVMSESGAEPSSPAQSSSALSPPSPSAPVTSEPEAPAATVEVDEPSSSADAEPPPAMAEAEEPPASSAMEKPSSALSTEIEQPSVAETEPPAAAPSAMEESAGDEIAAVETQAETAGGAATMPESADPGQPRNGKIVIQPGNSLWRISRVIYGRGIEYTIIYEANKENIRDPNLIYPGQIFATPGVVPPEMIDPQSTTPLAKTSDTPTSQQ